jgi:hypothetical protein
MSILQVKELRKTFGPPNSISGKARLCDRKREPGDDLTGFNSFGTPFLLLIDY